jgi:hypothetical protein
MGCAWASASAGIAIAQIMPTTRTTETLNIVSYLPDDSVLRLPARRRNRINSHVICDLARVYNAHSSRRGVSSV